LNAFVLITTGKGKLWTVAQEVRKLKGIEMAYAVTGQYDVIAFVEFEDITGLSQMVEKIQSLEGVLRTSTAVVMPRESAK
jgi:DNA-binding Lrp family transcriptional regulator